MKNKIEKFKKYCSKNYKTFLILILITTITYFIKLFYFSISIDSEVTINNINANDLPWIATGRWGIVVLEKIIHFGNVFNPIFSNIIMILFFTLSIIITSYLLSSIVKNEKLDKAILLICGTLIITSPAFAEMLNFTMMTAEVSISLLFLMISLYSTYMCIYQNKKIFYIISIAFLSFAMGCYQAYFPLYIGIASFIFAFEKINSKKSYTFKEDIINILKMIFIFALSYIVCSGITKILLIIFNLKSSSYLTDQITWGKIPFNDSFMNVFNYLKMVIFARNKLFFNYSYLIILILFAIYCCKLLKKEKGKSILTILALAFSLISPFLLTILMGNVNVVRSQMALPYVVALFTVLFLNSCNKQKLKTGIYIFCAVIAMIQFKSTSDLFYSDYSRYNEDVRLTQDIMNKIDMLVENREESKIVFVGAHHSKATQVSVIGETAGYSFYEWDIPTELGSNKRIHSFAKTLGYIYEIPTAEDYKFALEEIENIDIYPKKDSIKQINDIIIVRLS